MSAFAGIWTFDGAPVDPVWLAGAGAALDHRGPDGGREAIAGPVGMTYRAFHTTPEARHERQPSLRAGVGLLTWDGRLDNRDELRAGVGDRVRAGDPDVEHVWAAYERWGAAAFGRLIGDFALALWDARVRTLWLARDAIGTRTLYYAVRPNQMLWSSDIAPIVSSLGDVAIDEDFIATHLLDIPDFERTPYADIRVCPPGAACAFGHGRTSLDLFWRPESSPPITHRRDVDYEEHFKALLSDAVRSRLRTDRPAYVQLSGGLDSSSVACIARHLLLQREVGVPDVRTLSYVTDMTDTTSDEPFMTEVEEHLERKGHRLNHDRDYLNLEMMAEACAFWPNSAALAAARDRRVLDVMRTGGGRVLMSGFGGDHLLWPHAEAPPTLADLVVEGRLGALHKAIRVWGEVRKTSYLRMLWSGSVRPFRSGYPDISATPRLLQQRWLTPSIRCRARAAVRTRRARFQGPLPSMMARHQLFTLARFAVAPVKRFTAEPIEVSYPFLDRRLVEFCLAIPFDQILRPYEGRSIQRRALNGVLPERVRRRKSKGGSGYGIGRGLAREWVNLDLLFADARVFRRGWVRPREFAQSLELARAGLMSQLDALVRVLPLELWLRAYERRVAAPAAL